MPTTIKTIPLSMPYRLGSVNCYLVRTDAGYVLIDTGGRNNRGELERELEGSGCRPGDLKLVVLTHGDFDHTGNAAYLRETYGAEIAMHQDDAGMVERGDMFCNRQSGNPVLKIIAPLLFRFGRSCRFQAGVYLEDGDDLAGYGLDARVLAIPGHSKGSIGILTAEGDLFCGDLFDNTAGPALNAIMDDPAAARASVERLAGLTIRTVYPGHGELFPIEQFVKQDP